MFISTHEKSTAAAIMSRRIEERDMEMRLGSRILVLATTALLLTSCSTGTEEGKRGVAEFRARVSQRAFGEIYRTAAPEFRQAATQDQFLRLMEGLERKLGAWQSASEPVWNVQRGTGGHLVVLTYRSQFARGPENEQFSWRVEQGAPLLLGYHVNSALLVTE